MQKTFKPGEKSNRSGQFEIVGPRGGRTGEERTVVIREPFPPTPKSGQKYVLTDASKNGAGKGRK
ncbi:MAG: hypothetical protein IKL68_01085 [Clostridia bacterium]|nr:hypothetical protein [Clostridia bacterium]